MKKQYIVAKVKVLKDAGKVTVVASDETLDRHGDVLPMQNWDLAKFMLSPRMLVDHNHEVSSIVGKWNNTRIENGKLLMDADFHGITPLSKAVEEMVNKGYLDTVSVGFIYHGPEADGGHDSFELIETSWVTVPANPSARVMKSALQESDTLEFKSAVEKFLGKDLVDQPETEDDEDDIKAEDDKEETADEDDEDETEEKPADAGEELTLGTVIATVDMFKKLPAETEKVECSYDFISTLVADSEKLLTLTEGMKAAVEADFQSKLVKQALKEASRMVNHALREINAAHV